MGKTLDTASSTAVKNVDGLKDLVVELTEEQKAHQGELKQLVKNEKLSLLAFIMNCFKVGKKLVELKKIYKEDFYNIVNSSIISQEQVRRRMKLVLRLDVDFSVAMSNKGTAFDREENVALLVVDERFENLSIKDLEFAADLTLEKIAEMKHLSNEDWHTVLTKSDKPYQAHKDKKEADNKIIADVKKYVCEKDGLTRIEIDTFYEKGMNGMITLVKTANDSNAKLENNVSDLEEEKKILSDKLLVAETQLAMLEKIVDKTDGLPHYHITEKVAS